MKYFSLLLATWMLVGGPACKSLSSTAPSPSPTQITLLQLNDVYEIAPLENGQIGGLARVATLEKFLRLQNPNTIMVLAGDFLSPSVIGTVKLNGERVRGKHMVDLLNYIGMDWVVFGNHEFDVGVTALQARINESQFGWIGGNVFHKKGEDISPFAKINSQGSEPLKSSAIWKVPQPGRDSLRIGVLGLCLNSNQVDFVHYENVYASARLQFEALKNQTDFVIALTHLSIEQDRKLARQIPQLKLIMGGHEHEHHFERVSAVPIAKADANAKSAYVHQIQYDPISGKVNINSTLKLLNQEVKPDSATALEVLDWEDRAFAAFREQGFELKEIVATVDEPLDGLEKHIRTQPTNLGVMIAEGMYRYGEGADAAFFNGGSVRLDDYLSGSITQYDLIRALPFGGKVVLVDMKGMLVQQMLEAGEKNQGTGGYLQTFQIEKSPAGWKIGGEMLNPDKRYRIATNDFLLTGLEANMEFFTPDNPDLIAVIEPGTADLLRDIRLVLAKLLKEKSE